MRKAADWVLLALRLAAVTVLVWHIDFHSRWCQYAVMVLFATGGALDWIKRWWRTQ